MKKYNKTVVLIICILLGYFGIHRFYVGKIKSGILYLLTFGVFGFGWIFDIILIITNKFTEFEINTYNKNDNSYLAVNTTDDSRKFVTKNSVVAKRKQPDKKVQKYNQVSELSQKTKYVLNTKNKTIHRAHCRAISKIQPSNKRITSDIQKALRQGYSLCKVCKPTATSTISTTSYEQTKIIEQTTKNIQQEIMEDKELKGTISTLYDREPKDYESEYDFKVVGVTFEGRQEKLKQIYEDGVQSASLQWTEWQGEPAIKVICNKMDIGRIAADDVEFFIHGDIKNISELNVECLEKDNETIYYAKVCIIANDVLMAE